MNIKIVLIVLSIVSPAFLGCVEAPSGTPIPTVKPAETIVPTTVPATLIPTPVPSPSPGISLPVKYRVWIDSDLGFYRVRAIRGNSSVRLPPDFNILNFSIKLGDTVRWMNDDSYDFPLTITSDEGLWTDRTGLMRYQGERFEYTFNRTGTYSFYIREYPRIERQKITVNP
ncbi:MAG: hypothetical protein FIB08_07070 [Candidatus Methanoperedens sp.]|nr:hypothetical protein [Candidatus Methanoperedens sp.]